MRTLISASVLALMAASASFADDGDFAWSAGYSAIDLSEPGLDVTVGAVTFRGGYEFSRHFGFEGQLDIGANSDTIIVGAAAVEIDLDYAASLFAVARAPVSENVNLFIRGGYTTAQVDVSVPGLTISPDGGGWGYGAGAELFFDERNGFRIDLTHNDFDGTDATAFGIHYVRRFGGGR